MSSTGFRPAWWCRHPHCQTLWPRLSRYRPRIALRRQRLELPDGDFLDLDWGPATEGPIVLILHGLEGSAQSPYALGQVHALSQQGWRAVVLHFRGCSGEPNRLARGYHSGDTGDIDTVIRHLHQTHANSPLAIIGFSLGGNAMLKWLGEQAGQASVKAAVAVSVPYLLSAATERLHQGFSRVYESYFLRSLRRHVQHKRGKLPETIAKLDLDGLDSIREYDDKVTAPLHGFAGAEDYYQRSSARPYLKHIEVPSLLIQALDDPFMPSSVIPTAQELAPAVTLECSRHGGHVGFVGGLWPWRPRYWLEQRIPDFLRHYLR